MAKRQDTGLAGVLCINKPQEFTSFDVIAKLRGISGTRKIGHSGTLDPMATGVLPVFFGNAAKACSLLPDTDKRYKAGIRFGLTSDTQDVWGKLRETGTRAISREALAAALPAFTGEILQLPPMYSAVKVNGRRLYDLARQGIEVERKPRPVTVFSLGLLDFSLERQEAVLDVSCSQGTYIRTLCHDLGQRLGCGAVMSSLARTEAAGFSLADCVTLEEAQRKADDGEFAALLRPVESLFRDLPVITLNETQARMFINGVRLNLNRVRCCRIGGLHGVYGPEGAFLGLAFCDMGTMELAIEKLFYQRS